MSTGPLEGVTVLDFSQFLAGPSAAMRLADLGANVIKIERPGTGDLSRQLYLAADMKYDGDSLLYHTINRHKKGYAANLKDPADLERIKKLIASADVMIENFRPGVMTRLGLDYETVKQFNPGIVYGTITGYGTDGPWKTLPGQDLLAQSRSGLTWLSGDESQGPVPIGLSISDLITGAHLVQGILACLVRKGVSGKGGHVEVSLVESSLDLQFEFLTNFLNDGNKLPKRANIRSASAYLGAPYGIYPTADGYLALAMGDIPHLGTLLECSALIAFPDPDEWFSKRDSIKAILVEHLKKRKTQDWLDVLEPADYWCAPVLTWEDLLEQKGFEALQMTQYVGRNQEEGFTTLRCPIRVDGERFYSQQPAPRVGEHNDEIEQSLNEISE
ncbi:CaiB/BaiF CoA-transferase family protein [uncultured Cohaesibacter sp.]|uniref:CaiB/BaiF CoA transferase family protein n=1 Tax=uncultured Cohaesibacter sp. TaxID=1002546 RepID=UPI0029C83267|nr:CaiB/BaiF CoA-transferase family protein [uncultured Cohaesibacter sp.]